MATEHILALLVQERDKLNRAIEALVGPTKRRGRPPRAAEDPTMADGASPAVRKKNTRKKRIVTSEQRAAQAERMKLMWAKKKKAAKKAVS
jgi:hypothetical protein